LKVLNFKLYSKKYEIWSLLDICSGHGFHIGLIYSGHSLTNNTSLPPLKRTDING